MAGELTAKQLVNGLGGLVLGLGALALMVLIVVRAAQGDFVQAIFWLLALQAVIKSLVGSAKAARDKAS